MIRVPCTLVPLLLFIFSVHSEFIYQHPDASPKSSILSYEFDLSNNHKVREISKRKYKTQQYYKGLKIFDASLVIREDELSTQTPLFGNWYSTSKIDASLTDMTPTIAEDDALVLILTQLSIQSDDIHRMTTSELNIYPDSSTISPFDFCEAWVFAFLYLNVSQPETAFQAFAVVHAQGDHEILVLHTSARTMAACGNAGNDRTGTYRFGDTKGATWVRDTSPWTQKLIHWNYVIYDKKNQAWNSNGGARFECKRDETTNTCDADPYETERNGGYGTGIDAYHNTKITWNMYQAWMGEQPITSPKPFPIYVHVGWNWANAHFIYDRIDIGDGDGDWHPHVMLDTIAHEIAHGYTARYSELEYWGQSGGMDEAYSDMVAVAAWTYDRQGTTKWKDWKIGYYEARPNGNYECLRYMNNPPLDGWSVGSYCDYRNGMDVHGSSGIYNKAVFRLQRKSTIRKWTMEEIFKVWSTANKNYWTKTSTFTQGVCGLISALHDVYGSQGDVQLMEDALEDAFKGVGLKCGANICK